MNTFTRLQDAVQQSRQRRRQIRRLRNELADYRTPAERAELEAIFERHGTTVPQLLRTTR